MVLDFAGCVGHDALEDFAETDDFDFEAGFFHHLPQEGFFEGFTAFNGPTRQAPESLERFFASLHQQNPVAIKNQSSDTQNRFRWIAPNIEFYSYSVVTPLTFILARYTPVFAVM